MHKKDQKQTLIILEDKSVVLVGVFVFILIDVISDSHMRKLNLFFPLFICRAVFPMATVGHCVMRMSSVFAFRGFMLSILPNELGISFSLQVVQLQVLPVPDHSLCSSPHPRPKCQPNDQSIPQRGLCLTAFVQGRNEAKFPASDQGLMPFCELERYHCEQILTKRDGGQDRTGTFHDCTVCLQLPGRPQVQAVGISREKCFSIFR